MDLMPENSFKIFTRAHTQKNPYKIYYLLGEDVLLIIILHSNDTKPTIIKWFSHWREISDDPKTFVSSAVGVGEDSPSMIDLTGTAEAFEIFKMCGKEFL